MSVYDSYDFESRFVTIDGYDMHYVDEGPRDGEIVLFLHGNPTWSYLYRHQINGLRDRYRCVAPDLLGYGFSDKPPGADYSMRAHIMRLDSFVTKLGLKDITLVVQDWGGIIGLSWAVRHKQLVKRLVILNTAGFLAKPPRGKPALKDFPWGIAVLWLLKLPGLGELFVQGLNGFARFIVPYGIHHKERLTQQTMRGYLEPYPTWGSRRAHLASVRQIPMRLSDPVSKLLRDTGVELSDWKVPTQIIWGMKDPVFPSFLVEEFERRLPNHAPSLKLADASHFLQDDTPGPITEKIREFLESTKGAKGSPSRPSAGAA